MYKKIISTVAAAFIALSCTACGSFGNDGVQLVTSEKAAEKQTASDKKNKSYEIPEFSRDAVIEETVMVDEKDVRITATSLEYNNYSVELMLAIENNSDKNLSFVCGSVGYDCGSVNGYMIPGMYMNTDVAAGKTANESIEISTDELMVCGINEIADIEIGFDISDDEYDNYLQTGPCQVKTSIANTYDYSSSSFAKAIKDKNLMNALDYTFDCSYDDVFDFESGISVLSETVVTNKSGEKMLMIEMMNTSSKDCIAEISDIYMNGLLVEEGSWESNTVAAGKRYIGSISLTSLTRNIDAEAFGISTVSDMSFSIGTYNMDYDELYAPDIVNIKFPGKALPYDASGTELYNENGIRLVSKSLIDDSSEYSEDIHILLLAENNSGDEIEFKTVRDSLSVNGCMTDFYRVEVTLNSGEAAVLDVKALESSLGENGIAGADSVTEAEIKFEICGSDRNTIAEPVLTIKY